MIPINLAQKFDLITEYWSPKIVGELNSQQVKLAKLLGEFAWHFHEHEDELFFVVKGELQIAFRDHINTIKENEMLIVPRGVEHKPIAPKEVWILLFEPATTLNTGNVLNDMTQPQPDKI